MNIKSSLTLRYTLALGLIGCVLLMTHLVSSQRLEAASHDGHLIDISGMQRMLSQRVALRVSRMMQTDDPAALAIEAQRLEATLTSMARNHAELREDWQARASSGESVYASYLGPGGVESQIDDYMASGRRLLEWYAAGDLSAIREGEVSERLVRIADEGIFLGNLDSVVQQYKRENLATNESLDRFEMMSLLVGLGVLLIEVLFIFRPMVGRVTSCIEVLDEANEELRELASRLSHDLRSPIADSIKMIKIVDDALTSGKVRNAASVTGRVYTSMITLDGVLDELLEAVQLHRKAMVSFVGFGLRQK